MFSFEGNKALGLDGFLMLFFQWLWEIVEDEVVNVIKEFFGSRCLLNSTFLVLIPK